MTVRATYKGNVDYCSVEIHNTVFSFAHLKEKTVEISSKLFISGFTVSWDSTWQSQLDKMYSEEGTKTDRTTELGYVQDVCWWTYKRFWIVSTGMLQKDCFTLLFTEQLNPYMVRVSILSVTNANRQPPFKMKLEILKGLATQLDSFCFSPWWEFKQEENSI